MAGHSHASNVKHKKDRNDKLKGENFLKLRKKLENIYLEDGNYEKLVIIARENNFPIEKVKSLVEKIEKAQNSTFLFLRFLYKSSFEIIWFMECFLDQKKIKDLAEIEKNFQLEILKVENIFEHFERLYLLRLKSDEDFEDLAFSLFSPLVIDKIKRIDRVEVCGFNFEVIFFEKQAMDEAVESLKFQFDKIKLQTEIFLIPFHPVKIDSEKKNKYFLSLRKSFLELDCNVKIFTNAVNQKEDHSSVG